MSGRFRLALVLVVGLVATAPAIAEAVLVAEESAAIYPVEGERRLAIRDLRGQIFARIGVEGEVRFECRGMEGRDPLPVALWLDGASLELLPGRDAAEEAVRLEVSVPPNMTLTIETAGSTLGVSGLRADLVIDGEDLEIDARGLQGSVDLSVRRGTAKISNLAGDLFLDGASLEAEVVSLHGEMSATLGSSALRAREVNANVEVDLAESTLDLRGVRGTFRGTFNGGSASLGALGAGAVIRATNAGVELFDSRGDIDIETDADVRFSKCKAELHVNSWGGSLRGSGNTGLLEIKTTDAEIDVEDIQGPVRVEGEGLTVRLANIGGELMVYASSSDVRIEAAGAPVTVENEFGNITVDGAKQKVEVFSRDGDVRLSGLVDSVQVDADGPEVTVAWNSMNMKSDSSIRNEGGDIVARFPTLGGGRVVAEAGFGGVESSIEDIVASDDGRTAEGILNRRGRPVIRLESAGRMRLLSIEGVEEE